MSILLETTFGDVVVDLDIDGSPALCKNILKLVKARYYTNTLVYNVVPGKYSQMGGKYLFVFVLCYVCSWLCCIHFTIHISYCYLHNIDPKGDGTGGCSIYGLIDSYQSSPSSNTNNKQPPDVTQSKRRFLQSHGRTLSTNELNQKGLLIAMEIGNVPHTIGSQFLLTLSDNNGLNDLISTTQDTALNGNDKQQQANNNSQTRYLSLGKVTEDTQNVLNKLNRAYCDDDGRPYADIRIIRALVVSDPYDDPEGMSELLKLRGVTTTGEDDDDMKDGYPLAPSSPTYERPPEETVPVRIQADDTTLFATAGWDDNNNGDDSEDEDEETKQKRLELQAKQEEEWKQRQDTSRAVMLEMLGDRPSAEIEAPENVLFVCKLNPFTNDEDLELIFSRFDQEAKAEIIRDPDTGASLQYAFVEFKSNEAANEAYLKMNNALVDDRRIRVDFSQSVSNVWDRFNKKYRRGDKSAGIDRGFMDNGSGRGRGRGGGRGRGNWGRGRGPGRGHHLGPRGQSSTYRPSNHHQQQNHQLSPRYNDRDRKEPGSDNFGRRLQDTNPGYHSKSHDDEERQNPHLRSRSRSRDYDSREDRRRRKHSRRSRSRSDSSDYSRRRKKKKRHKHSRRKDNSRHRKRSRSDSRERERKHKHKKHRHRRRDEDDDERRHDRKHHRRDDRSRSR